MNWTDLLQHYGYFAIFIGAFFEGENVLMLGAYAVHQHVMSFWLLIAVAVVGSFIGDQFYYQVGRRYGQKLLQTKPKFAEKFERASQFIERFPILTILLMRFAWGLRTVLPITVGIKAYPLWKYILINLMACFLWALIVVSFGLQMSHWLHLFWTKMLPYHQGINIIVYVIVCLLMIKVIYVITMYLKSKK